MINRTLKGCAEGNGIEGFMLTAPASLTVPRGRCLLIPCQFTYRSDSSSPNENFFAYWFKDKEGPKYCFRDALSSLCVPGLLVATNDDAELVERTAVYRFYLVGNANKGNCSLLITDAQLEDEGSYYFRIIGGGGLKFSYSPQFQDGCNVFKNSLVPGNVLVFGAIRESQLRCLWKMSNIPEYPLSERLSAGVFFSTFPVDFQHTIKLDRPGSISLVGLSSKKKDLGTKIVQEGDTIRLLCTAKSRPDPTLTWRKDGENIGLLQQGKESAYEIPSATSRDAGKYECQAENELGSAKESIQLIVQYPPRFVMFSFSQSLGKDPSLTQDFPREISSLANGSRLNVQGGDSLELLCQAYSDPPVATVWITPTLEKIQDDRLELVNLTIKDEGQYLCQADNFLGSAQGVLTLSITFSGAPNETLPANVGLLLLILLGVNKHSRADALTKSIWKDCNKTAITPKGDSTSESRVTKTRVLRREDMSRSIEIWMLGLVSAALLWEGLQCDRTEYRINVPIMVSVQEGLCVTIPCKFTYDTNDSSTDSPLYGYWYREGEYMADAAVATNDNLKRIEEDAQGRFHLSEEVGRGNCSLIISDARGTDQKNYYFRMEKEPGAKFTYINYPHRQPFVNVTKLENPKIQMPGKLQEGHQVNITCTAPESCSWKRPHISWKGRPVHLRPGIPAAQANNFKDHISVLNFVPSAADDGQELTSLVTYGEGLNPLHRHETVLLNVNWSRNETRKCVDLSPTIPLMLVLCLNK
ncbi:hypothetical protein JRQ81_011594 [Phrynocephalus forsythii]|uniref:Ig-like domain-containing protein n=1 Tax=Phrynocephalus forsythii TaxID=171643 RepID=A0A9Q0X682_9SAUR|nr:hypothetical protein JRQ81_011594 [Phrynocephalus forsythii]